ncbi:glycosyltransferase [Aeropyrum camini]|uniref:glycosyltransferase n=1 Tax=Aeropyrum camini TaxID=229980 RepID=UPI001E5B2C28|nr:glycosyltransferase [Aeropyrum camini]
MPRSELALKIAFVSRYPPVHCGVGEYTRMLASGLRTVLPSASIRVYSTGEAGWERYYDEPLGVEIIPSYMRRDPSYEGLIKNLEDDGGADVVHLQHEYGIYGDGPRIVDALLETLKRGLASAVVATFHTVVHKQSTASQERLETQRRASRLHAIITHSILMEFELQAQGVDPSVIVKIPHGTLVNPYLGYPRHRLAEKLGVEVEDSELLLVTPGFLRPDKGLDILASAAALVGDSRLRIVVAGEPMGVAPEEIPSMGGRIKVIEKYLSTDEILMLAAMSDAIVLPYKDRPGKYSVSGVLHLSMGSLKPVLGTRVPRLVELYEYSPMLTVPPRSPELLARRMEWLSRNYEIAASASAQLYSYAAATQWPMVASQHIALYRGVMEGKPPAYYNYWR